MQTLNIDGTTYTLKFDKCPIEWAKLARKAWKPKKPKDIRKFPVIGVSTSTYDYIRRFDELNFLRSVNYHNASPRGHAAYDPTIPLLEELSDENAN
jgi:hypothetical protein